MDNLSGLIEVAQWALIAVAFYKLRQNDRDLELLSLSATLASRERVARREAESKERGGLS